MLVFLVQYSGAIMVHFFFFEITGIALEISAPCSGTCADLLPLKIAPCGDVINGHWLLLVMLGLVLIDISF